jgi:hypothetical protein
MKKFDTTFFRSVRVKGLRFDNDMGGTETVKGPFVVCADEHFHDYECGHRFVGHLCNAKDETTLKKKGHTGFASKTKEKKYVKNPLRVYFGEFDLYDETIVNGLSRD